MNKNCFTLLILIVIWKFNISDKIKLEFFQSVAMSVLLLHYLKSNKMPGEKAR